MPLPSRTIGDRIFTYYLKESSPLNPHTERDITNHHQQPLSNTTIITGESKDHPLSLSTETIVNTEWKNKLNPKPVEPEVNTEWRDELNPKPVEPEVNTEWRDELNPKPVEPEVKTEWRDELNPKLVEPEVNTEWRDELNPKPVEPEVNAEWKDELDPKPVEPEVNAEWKDELDPKPVEPEVNAEWKDELNPKPVEPEVKTEWKDELDPKPVEPEVKTEWKDELDPKPVEPEVKTEWRNELDPKPVEPEVNAEWRDELDPKPVEPEVNTEWRDELNPKPMPEQAWVSSDYLSQTDTELSLRIEKPQERKLKPSLTVAKVTIDEENGSVTLDYQITDTDNTYISAKTALYKGDKLVSEINLPKDQTSITIDNLESSIPYTLQTSLTYNLGVADQTDHVDQRQVELLVKKVEFRNVLAAELYQVTPEGQLDRINGLKTIPEKLDNYIVKLVNAKQKDVYLPVQAIAPGADNTLRVTASHPELVQFNGNDMTQGYSFTIDKIVLKEGAYASFEELITAMKAKPNGEFFLASDMIVPPSATSETAYLPTFSGKLSSSDPAKRFAIINLDKPLFGHLNNATITNIALKDIAINQPTQTDVGALAKTATGTSTISHIDIKGSISGKNNLAGLVATAANTSNISHITAQVNLSASERMNSYNMGGIIATSNGKLNHVKAQITIDQTLTRGSNIGGVVGQNGGTLTNAYATGSIIAKNAGANIGGVAGSGKFDWTTFQASTASNLISGVAVTNGNSLVGMTSGGNFSQAFTTPTASGITSGIASTKISQEDAITRSSTWGAKPVTPSVNTAKPDAPKATENFSFSSVAGYQANRQQAYDNIEKLLPYYDRHTIIAYGNKVDPSDPLFSKPLLAVVPMSESGFVTNTLDHPEISKLLLHFADNTKTEVALTAKKPYKATSIREFSFGDLLYTPEQFSHVNQADIEDLVKQLAAVPEWTKEGLIQLLNIQDEYMEGGITRSLTKEAVAERLLYLNKPLRQLQTDLEKNIKALISSYSSIDMTSEALARYLKTQITQEKEKLLLALAHLKQSYNVHYGHVSILDIVTYRPDFGGQKIDTLDYLLSFAQDAHSLKLYQNPTTYEKKMANKISQAATLVDFLEEKRALFLPDKSNEDWFKENTKAFIYEQPSLQKTDADVNLYRKLRDYTFEGKKPYLKHILPLLNLTEEHQLYVLSSMTTLNFGLFDQYVKANLKKENPQQYAAEIEQVKSTLIPLRMKELGNFLDLWYRLSSSETREELLTRQTLVQQGYHVLTPDNKKRWLAEYGDANSAVDDFFGPMGEYYPSDRQSAFANGINAIKFLGVDLLSVAGSSTLTHELVHNYDRAVILNGNQRRIGQSSESYALGLLQSVSSTEDYYYGFNFNREFTSPANHNSSPSRFQNPKDLQDYMKGVMDVTYTLDLLELEAIGKQSKADQQLFFNQLALVPQAEETSNNITYRHANDRIKALTADEWQKVTTLSVNNLIDHNIIMKDATGMNGIKDYVRDNSANYYWIIFSAPIYGGITNEQGTVGGLQFRRVAYELLAAKGWQNGFIPYVSDQYRAEAEASNKPLSDTFILKKIFGTDMTYTDFKKAEYQERADKLNQLKAISISLDGQKHDITNANDIIRLFEDASQKDLANLKLNRPAQARHKLKLAIIKAYHQLTDDFKQTIYR
ncbi:ZmpA/ZmpB/ZmpC family metallo-endopeptidase [Streptococcus pluranimalium]|uniref:ZmpA/ZmpB/ZmpC family metallo-endopeptidase n=1 Tax=Streptococcus pluranimalium TaxID=82348 RepID=UPI0039FC4EB1